MQNAAARMVTGTRKYDHITPALIELHWLPVRARIEFKILTIVYRCLHGTAPSYLESLIDREVPVAPVAVANRTRRSARHANEVRLVPRDYNQKTFGRRAFTYTAPELWNALPANIRSSPSLHAFKSRLKTHLFIAHYNL